MSSGAFIISKYESDIIANIRPIKIQPETLGLVVGSQTNTAPTGAAVGGLGSAQVSSGKRSLGVHARTITIKFDTAPTGYKQGGLIRLPILRKAMFDGIARGATGTYLEEAITVVGVSSEEIR